MTEDPDFLSTEDLVLVARSAVGPHVQVRDYGLLDSAAHRPRAYVFGEDVYPRWRARQRSCWPASSTTTLS